MDAVLRLHGAHAPQWRVVVSTLPRNHIVAVATAPPSEIVDKVWHECVQGHWSFISRGVRIMCW